MSGTFLDLRSRKVAAMLSHIKIRATSAAKTDFA